MLRLNAAIRLLDKEILVSLCKWQQCLWLLGKSFSAPFPEKCRCYHLCKAKQTSLLLREGKLFPKGPKCYSPFRKRVSVFRVNPSSGQMFVQIFIPLRLFALRGRYLSKVCSVGKSSGVPLPIQGGVSVNPSLGTIWNKLLLLPSAISTCWASGLPSAGGNSSLGPNFRKLFPYEYRLKCKYIHPCSTYDIQNYDIQNYDIKAMTSKL